MGNSAYHAGGDAQHVTITHTDKIALGQPITHTNEIVILQSASAPDDSHRIRLIEQKSPYRLPAGKTTVHYQGMATSIVPDQSQTRGCKEIRHVVRVTAV